MEIIIGLFFITFIWTLVTDSYDKRHRYDNETKEMTTFTKVPSTIEEDIKVFSDMIKITSKEGKSKHKQPKNTSHSTKYESKQDYLHSPEWNNKRKERLAKDNYTCQACKEDEILLEVHHINYNTLYNEDIKSLVSLCRDCHQATHDKYGYKGNNFPPVRK